MRKLRSIRGARSEGPAGDERPRDLLDELSAAASLDAAAAPYLSLLCARLTGVRNALLVLGPPERGPFEVAASWPEGEAPPASLLEGAERALRSRKPLVASGRPGDGESAAAVQALDVSLIAQPLELDGGKLHGALVLQLAARNEVELHELQRELRFGFGWLEAGLRRGGSRLAHSREGRLELVPNLLATTLDHADLAGAARSFVTELSAELGCERVSLGFTRRAHVRLFASSHAAHAGEGTNWVHALEAAMEEALDERATLVHPSSKPDAGRLHAHEELAKQHGASGLCSVPIVHAGRACAVLTLEHTGERRFDPVTVQALEVVASLVGPVFEWMRLAERGALWRGFDEVREWAVRLVGPRYVARKLVAAGLALALIFFTFAKGEYRVTAPSVLEPAIRRAAVAPFDGYVAEAMARAGDVVHAGDLLATLDTRDLHLEQVRWSSQLEQLERQRQQALATRDASQVGILTASRDEARAELDRIEDRLERARLVAPFDAVVVAGDLSQRLGAPVEKGSVLFEVAPLDAFRTILQVDETDVADVQVGQTGSVVFTALPERTLPFAVEKLTPVALAEDGRNYFRVEARLDEADARLRPAIEGVAKVGVGRRRLIWIWTHDATEWLRVKLWRWLP